MITKKKARKIHTCYTCREEIQIGEIYEHIQERLPVYDENDDNQISIEYVQYKTCATCVKKEEELIEKQNNCKHENIKHSGDPDDSYVYCLDCGKYYIPK